MSIGPHCGSGCELRYGASWGSKPGPLFVLGAHQLGDEGTQAVYQGEGDARQDISTLVVETEAYVADCNSHGGDDEDRRRHVYVVWLVFAPRLLDVGTESCQG